jgi:hypothetical protein
MNNKQIKMLRFIVKQEIEAAGIDGMKHGAWSIGHRVISRTFFLR